MKKTHPLTLTALAALVTGLHGTGQPARTPLTFATNLLAITSAEAAGSTVYNMRVDGMTCPFCVKTSEKALKAIPGVKSVSTNLKKGVITVCASPSAGITAARMKSLFANKGFTFRSMKSGRAC